MFLLDQACRPINEAFGSFGCYLVGTSAVRGPYRDVDVRCIMRDKRHDKLTKAIGETGIAFLGLAIGQYLASLTGLPIDFQIQRQTEANALHDGIRNPLGHRTLANYMGDANRKDVAALSAETQKGERVKITAMIPDEHGNLVDRKVELSAEMTALIREGQIPHAFSIDDGVGNIHNKPWVTTISREEMEQPALSLNTELDESLHREEMTDPVQPDQPMQDAWGPMPTTGPTGNAPASDSTPKILPPPPNVNPANFQPGP
jgi:hypothetical protein